MQGHQEGGRRIPSVNVSIGIVSFTRSSSDMICCLAAERKTDRPAGEITPSTNTVLRGKWQTVRCAEKHKSTLTAKRERLAA